MQQIPEDSTATTAVSQPSDAPPPVVQLTSFVESAIWPARSEWRTWGQQHLQTGDLVFIRSNYRVLLGTFNLSRFLAEVADSPFSHVGVVAFVEGRPLVYDASDKGVTAQPFETFVTADGVQRVAVRRLDAEHQHAVSAAVEFIQMHEQHNTPFDARFQLGDDKLYCTELVVRAFQQRDLSLCQPVAVAELPGLEDVPPMTLRMAEWATGLDERDLVWLPGNDAGGLFGSAHLVTVLEPTEL